jgi:tRNA(Arg) A34 adenosine deaminase TadA
VRLPRRDLGAALPHLGALAAEGVMREALVEAAAAGEPGERPIGLGAAVMADVPHVVYAVHDPLVETHRLIEGSPYVARHIETYCGGVLADEATELIARYDAVNPGG